jgi:hypothetical protein
VVAGTAVGGVKDGKSDGGVEDGGSEAKKCEAEVWWARRARPTVAAYNYLSFLNCLPFSQYVTIN